jgi:hypothetical protein
MYSPKELAMTTMTLKSVSSAPIETAPDATSLRGDLLARFKVVLADMPEAIVDTVTLEDWLLRLSRAGCFVAFGGRSEVARYLKLFGRKDAPSSYCRGGFVRMADDATAALVTL